MTPKSIDKDTTPPSEADQPSFQEKLTTAQPQSWRNLPRDQLSSSGVLRIFQKASDSGKQR